MDLQSNENVNRVTDKDIRSFRLGTTSAIAALEHQFGQITTLTLRQVALERISAKLDKVETGRPMNNIHTPSVLVPMKKSNKNSNSSI